MGRRLAVLLALACAGVFPGAAAASELVDVDASDVRLAVSPDGYARVSYRARGVERRVLVWGALDAHSPSLDLPQVRFQRDYSGGHRRFGAAFVKRFRNACGRYDGPELPWLVRACKAPDGSYFAVQEWQRKLPHRGHPGWLPSHAARDLRVSHWSGPLARLEVWTDWAFGGAAHALFGRLSLGVRAVHGFSTTANGEPRDRYGRNLYIDTFNSAYGAGWRRETSIVSRRPTGSFCYSFWPTRDRTLPGYPDTLRPAGKGERYRITVIGPGVTPDVAWEGRGLHDYDPRNPADAAYEERMNRVFDTVTAGDRFCPTQR